MHSLTRRDISFDPSQVRAEEDLRPKPELYLHTLQTGVHSASLYKLNHFRSFGFSPAAAPSIFLLRPNFRSSIDATKYRNASIA